MRRQWHRNGYSLYLGDVVEELSGFDDNTFDACLSDPPYFLEFMGKGFDKQHKKTAGDNDGQKMYQWHLMWCREVYRVLKPGGFILAFGGTRTVHRLACAMEDVGFEIRDMVSWLYGQGFPKGLDISKAIDKMNGDDRDVIGVRQYGDGHIQRSSDDKLAPPIGTFKRTQDDRLETSAGSKQSTLWSGYGTALKPAHEPLVLAMKPCEGTFAENTIEYGVGGLNIDGGRIETEGGGTGGRWPANLILSHHSSCQDERDGDGECHPLCPIRLLDEQSGVLTSHGQKRPFNSKPRSIYGAGLDRKTFEPRSTNTGGASRFFAHFYVPKVSNRERNLGNIDCRHPTLKPIDLCRYLATLLLPPPRKSDPRQLIVPFSGAGSEVAGALIAGWDKVIGIEFDPEYVEYAKQRVSAVVKGNNL